MIKKPIISEENKEKNKEHNERLIKNRLIKDISTLLEQQEDYYKPERVNGF